MLKCTVTQHDSMQALTLLIDRLEKTWLPENNDQLHNSEEYYGYISYPINQFINNMLEIKQQIETETHASGTNGRFLDVGCGIGSKLLLAHYLGWSDVTGIELRTEYAEVARNLCPEADIEIADAFKWDKYAEFDIIFMYRPCIKDALQIELENRVMSLVKPGTFLFFGQPASFGGEMRRI